MRRAILWFFGIVSGGAAIAAFATDETPRDGKWQEEVRQVEWAAACSDDLEPYIGILASAALADPYDFISWHDPEAAQADILATYPEFVPDPDLEGDVIAPLTAPHGDIGAIALTILSKDHVERTIRIDLAAVLRQQAGNEMDATGCVITITTDMHWVERSGLGSS